MKIEEKKVEGSTDVMLDIIFEEEDADLYNDFSKMAEIKNMTAQELMEEVFTMDNLLKGCSDKEKKLIKSIVI